MNIKIKTAAVAIAAVLSASVASAQTYSNGPASSPNSGVDKPGNSGVGAATPPGYVAPGSTGSIAPMSNAPASSPNSGVDRPSNSGGPSVGAAGVNPVTNSRTR